MIDFLVLNPKERLITNDLYPSYYGRTHNYLFFLAKAYQEMALIQYQVITSIDFIAA